MISTLLLVALAQCVTGPQGYFVDASTGNDANNCTAGGTRACATIQGALNKIPKLLQYGVTVTVAAGTYGCFYVSGFTCDPGIQTTTGGISIDGLGALTNSTLASGSATGSFTSSAAGSGVTFGTGTDTGATWTVDDLKGRFVTSAGQTRIISSNTATTLTIVGTWASPGAVAYAIQDPGVIINTGCPSPATATQAPSTATAAIFVNDNHCVARTRSVLLRGMRTTNGAAFSQGINYDDSGGLNLTLMQLRSAQDSEFVMGAAGSGDGNSTVIMTDLEMNATGTTANPLLSVFAGGISVTRLLVRNSHAAVQLSGPSAMAFLSALDVQGAVNAPAISIIEGSALNVTGSHLDCLNSNPAAIVVGGAPSVVATTNNRRSFTNVTSAVVSTCGIGIAVAGALSAAELTGLTGAAATVGMSVTMGGSISFSKSGTTLTGGTSDINLESGGTTAALSDIVAGSCLSTAGFNSQVCGR